MTAKQVPLNLNPPSIAGNVTVWIPEETINAFNTNVSAVDTDADTNSSRVDFVIISSSSKYAVVPGAGATANQLILRPIVRLDIDTYVLTLSSGLQHFSCCNLI